MTTQRRHHAPISGEDLYRRVIEAAQSGKRLPAGALLDADNYADFIRAMTNANGMDDNTAAVVRRYLGLAHSVQLDPVQDYDRFYHRLFNTPTRSQPFSNPIETDAKILSGPHGPTSTDNSSATRTRKQPTTSYEPCATSTRRRWKAHSSTPRLTVVCRTPGPHWLSRLAVPKYASGLRHSSRTPPQRATTSFGL